MTDDPIVREVRKIRREIELESQQDPDKYYQYLIGSQEKLAGRLVCRGPKRLVSAKQKSTGQRIRLRT